MFVRKKFEYVDESVVYISHRECCCFFICRSFIIRFRYDFTEDAQCSTYCQNMIILTEIDFTLRHFNILELYPLKMLKYICLFKKKCKTSHRRMVDINQLQVIIRKPFFSHPDLRRVWRYQRGNQNPYIEENRQHNGQKKKSTKGQTTIYGCGIQNNTSNASSLL
jgi:hypothetical protein